MVAEAAGLRSAAQALLLAATAALEADREGSGRTALREQARLSARGAKRTAETSSQIAQMPNVARGLATGALTGEHAEVLADAARQTSPEAVDTAAELLEAAAAVPPEVLRRDAQGFAARWDPAAVRSVLDRQRRDRSAALFIDHSTGMGVLNARLDPVSFALVRQAVENYCDALWRADGGRDGTPGEIRNNPQRLADAVFEMLADRNALTAIGHPTARTPHTPHSPDDTPHSPGDTPHPCGGTEPANGGHIEHHAPSHPEPGSRCGGIEPANGGHIEHHAPGHPEPGSRCGGIEPANGGHMEQHALGDPEPGSRCGGIEPAQHRHRAGPEGHRSAGSECGGGDAVRDSAPSRSIERWRPAQAPNQLVIIADIGVIDGTKPDGLCEALGAGPVPPAILDDLSPDTRISGAVFGGPGQVLWHGRSRRHASTPQQLAIAIRDRGCVLCRKPMHRCQYHHIDEWHADSGTTDEDNLAALCNDCHNSLHNNNRRLRRLATPGQWTTEPRPDPP